MVEKGIRGGICHAIHRYAKAINKYMKHYDKNEESHILINETLIYMQSIRTGNVAKVVCKWF